MLVRDGDLALIEKLLDCDWGALCTPFLSSAFDLNGLQSAFRFGAVFSIPSLMSLPGEFPRAFSHIEEGSTRRGSGEYLLQCFPGAEYAKKGDVFVPGIGNVEIKATASSASDVKMVGSRLNHKSTFVGMSEVCREICGKEIRAFGYAEMKSFFASATDTDAYGTAIAACINQMFPTCDRVADLLLSKGFVRRLRAAALNDTFCENMDREILYPVLEFSFDYYKAVGEFNTLLLMNPEGKAIFINNGEELIRSITKGHIKMKPSSFSLVSPRPSGIGIRLV